MDPELGDGPHDDGFVFPDEGPECQSSSRRTCPSPCRSPSRQSIPTTVSHTKIETEPFYLNVADIDPQKSWNPMSDSRFAHSYNGSAQPVQILAKRDINGDGAEDPVTVHYSINGRPPLDTPTEEWDGGDRYGKSGDVYYRIVQGTITGAIAGDKVQVWFTGGGATSDSFTFDVVGSAPKDVLVVAAEDYSGPSNEPAYTSTAGPHLLSFYTEALTANGILFDVYDVDARGRTAPDHLGVLGHSSGGGLVHRQRLAHPRPGQPGGTGASTLREQRDARAARLSQRRWRPALHGPQRGMAVRQRLRLQP